MRRHQGLALLVFLLSALAALSGCGGGENTNANTSANTNASNLNASVNANATPPSPNSPLSVEEIKQGMSWGEVAFNVPLSLRLGEPHTVELVLSPTQTGEELIGVVRDSGADGNIESHRIKISKEMQAVLKGDGVHVEPVTTPDTLPVSKYEPTRWVWDVRPLRAGKVTLHFVVNAMVNYNDGKAPHARSIKTFDKVYDVEVPRQENVAVAPPPVRAGGVWPWLLPALLVPAGGVAAWLWLRGRQRRSRVSHWFNSDDGEAKIFLSYRRDDAAGHAGRLRDSLADRFGPARVFMDLESIRAGDDFVEIVKKAVASSSVVIVVIGKQWLSAADKKGHRRLDHADDFVRLEVETALRRGVRVIPALVQGAEMPGEDALPESLAKLARRNAIEISNSRWAFDVERLVAAVEEALAQELAKQAEPGGRPG